MLSSQRRSSGWRQGALPPTPLLFHPESVGMNVLVHGGGCGAEWVHRQHLGRCGLDKPLKRSRAVSLEVSGTGYFTLDLRSQPLTEEDVKASAKCPSDNCVKEISFKLKRSQLSILMERPARSSELTITFWNRQGAVNTERVNLPDQTNPWVTLNILFGSLNITCASAGKNKRDWKFQGPFGMNVVCKSKKEVSSRLSNPCAIVATERPLSRKEVTELSFVPLNRQQQSSVKLYLSNSHPSSLKLQEDLSYFDPEDGAYSCLQLVYQMRKFEGRIQLHLHETKDQLELKLYEKKTGRGAECYSTHRVPVTGSHVDIRKPVFLCLELFRVKVDVNSVFLYSKSWEESAYATLIKAEDNARWRNHAAISFRDSQQEQDDSALYLTPLTDEGFPDLPGGRHSTTSTESGTTSTTAIVHQPMDLGCAPFRNTLSTRESGSGMGSNLTDEDINPYECVEENSDDETLVKQVWSPSSLSSETRAMTTKEKSAEEDCNTYKTFTDVIAKRRRSDSHSGGGERGAGYEEPVRKLQKSKEEKSELGFRHPSAMLGARSQSGDQTSCQPMQQEDLYRSSEDLSYKHDSIQVAKVLEGRLQEASSLSSDEASDRSRPRSQGAAPGSPDCHPEKLNEQVHDMKAVHEKVLKLIDDVQNLDETVRRIDIQLRRMSMSAPELSLSPSETGASSHFMTGFRCRLQKRFTLWVERLDPVPVVDLLFQNGVISWDTLDRIQRLDLRQKQTREVLAILLQKPHAESVFRDALQKSHQVDLLAALDDVDLDPSVLPNT